MLTGILKLNCGIILKRTFRKRMFVLTALEKMNKRSATAGYAGGI
jgi:hypothetical protein